MRLQDAEAKFPEVTVSTPGGDVAVRGLSLDDVLRIVRENRGAVAGLFDQFKTGALNLDDSTSVGRIIVDQAPDVAAHIIALTADDGDAKAKAAAARLPFPLQIEFLEAVKNQTFSEGLDVGKITESIVNLMQGMAGLVRNLNPAPQTFLIGSEGSESK